MSEGPPAGVDAIMPTGEAFHGDGYDALDRLGPISGYACYLEYGETGQRLVSCRSLFARGNNLYLGTVCIGGYRNFRCDRIVSVYDLETGEHLGDGSFFQRFDAGEAKIAKDYWGLTRSRHSHLIAGLNILAFMAHCDGHWHPLEADTIQDFVCSLWMRKEWEGEPPLSSITKYAQHLAPDGSVFGAALRNFVRSETSLRVLGRYIEAVIAADGKITEDEFKSAIYFREIIEEYKQPDHPNGEA